MQSDGIPFKTDANVGLHVFMHDMKRVEAWIRKTEMIRVDSWTIYPDKAGAAMGKKGFYELGKPGKNTRRGKLKKPENFLKNF